MRGNITRFLCGTTFAVLAAVAAVSANAACWVIFYQPQVPKALRK